MQASIKALTSFIFVSVLTGNLFGISHNLSYSAPSLLPTLKDPPFVRRVIHSFSERKNYNIKFSGHIHMQSFYDSRQIKGQYNDLYVLFPLPYEQDDCCGDIDAASQFSMMAIDTYFIADVFGPKIWEAKVNAKIEGRFVGLGDFSSALLSLHRGFFTFLWPNTMLLLGYSYHPIDRDRPLGGERLFPNTVSSGNGILFDPFQYVSQVRLRHKAGDNLEFVFALTKNFESRMARWSVIPDLFFQVSTRVKDQVFGFGINYHLETPRLVTEVENNDKTNEQIASICPNLFALLRFKKFRAKARFLYVENGHALNLIGSYAVDYFNPNTKERHYINLRALNAWLDMAYAGKRTEPGMFIGFSKNIGASGDIIKSFQYLVNFCRPLFDLFLGQQFEQSAGLPPIVDADYMFILSPRIRLFFGPLVVGAEINYFRAAYSARRVRQRVREACEDAWECDFDSRGRVINAVPVSNMRLLVVTNYYF